MFGDKEFNPKTPKYPTPADLPLETACRTFSIPSDAAWLGVFMGMLMQGLDPENWQQFEGGISPEAAADEWAAIFDSGYDEGGTCSTIDRPYWDDATAEDAGDSETDGFPWYEDAADWVVGSFLATAGIGEAAFEFVTVARRLRLFFRKREWGAIVKVFLDGVLQGEVDTYGATEGQTFIDIFPEVMPMGMRALVDPSWTLRIEHSGEHNPDAVPLAGQYNIEVIRKRLWAGELGPTNQRYNPETDTIEETFDGGETWVERPLLDPRHAPQFRFPPIGGSDPQCQAAANMRAFFEELVSQVLGVIDAGGDVSFLITLFAILFLPLGIWAVLVEVFAALAAVMFSAGSVALTAAFSPSIFEELQCIFYCNISADGTVTDAQHAAIIADIGEMSNPITVTVMQTALTLVMGPVGLSNQGTIGVTAADCSSCGCEWRYRWDFLTSDGSFVFDPDQSPYNVGTWTEGLGWGMNATGGSSGCAAMIYATGIKSQPFDIPSDCSIEGMALTATNQVSCAHAEAYVGNTRSVGLSLTPLIYTDPGWSGTLTATGEINGSQTGWHTGISQSHSAPDGYITAYELSGFGTPPDFTGGEFI